MKIILDANIIFAAIFGSRAKETASNDSDYDLLVEFDPKKDVDVFEFTEIKDSLEKTLQSQVDLVTIYGLGSQSFRKEVLNTMKVLYGTRKV